MIYHLKLLTSYQSMKIVNLFGPGIILKYDFSCFFCPFTGFGRIKFLLTAMDLMPMIFLNT